MRSDHKEMLRQLKNSVKQLDKSKKIATRVVDDMITQLPEDKRKQAIDLLKKANQGKHIDLNEMMSFVGKMPASDEKKVKDSVQRANNKRDEVTSK